jgi:hypothetical protein
MKDDTVMKRIKTNIDLIAEQIGADIADATATGDHFLLYERMVANLESLEGYVDKMARDLMFEEKQ